MPSDDDLGRRLAVSGGHAGEHWMIEAAGPKRAVLEFDTACSALVEQAPVELKRAPPHLIDRRGYPGGTCQLIDLRERIVADPDRARLPVLRARAKARQESTPARATAGQ